MQWSSDRASDFRSRGPGSKPPMVVLDFSVEGTRVQKHFCRFEAWATSFTPLCLCLSEETVNANGPFYLVPTPGEVKDPTQGNGKCLLQTH